jgi:hypothetical protein
VTAIDRLWRLHIGLIALAFVVCLALFAARTSQLGTSGLDGRRQGYCATEVSAFLGSIGPGGRQLYAWTEVTLDAIFPAIYGLLVARVIAWGELPGVWQHAIWLPWLTAAFDYGENGLLAYLAWSFERGVSSRVVMVASLLTQAKWAAGGLALVAAALSLAFAAWRALAGGRGA